MHVYYLRVRGSVTCWEKLFERYPTEALKSLSRSLDVPRHEWACFVEAVSMNGLFSPLIQHEILVEEVLLNLLRHS